MLGGPCRGWKGCAHLPEALKEALSPLGAAVATAVNDGEGGLGEGGEAEHGGRLGGDEHGGPSRHSAGGAVLRQGERGRDKRQGGACHAGKHHKGEQYTCIVPN